MAMWLMESCFWMMAGAFFALLLVGGGALHVGAAVAAVIGAVLCEVVRENRRRRERGVRDGW